MRETDIQAEKLKETYGHVSRVDDSLARLLNQIEQHIAAAEELLKEREVSSRKLLETVLAAMQAVAPRETRAPRALRVVPKHEPQGAQEERSAPSLPACPQDAV